MNIITVGQIAIGNGIYASASSAVHLNQFNPDNHMNRKENKKSISRLAGEAARPHHWNTCRDTVNDLKRTQEKCFVCDQNVQWLTRVSEHHLRQYNFFKIGPNDISLFFFFLKS